MTDEELMEHHRAAIKATIIEREFILKDDDPLLWIHRHSQQGDFFYAVPCLAQDLYIYRELIEDYKGYNQERYVSPLEAKAIILELIDTVTGIKGEHLRSVLRKIIAALFAKAYPKV
jgi:hypothetical protein